MNARLQNISYIMHMYMYMYIVAIIMLHPLSIHVHVCAWQVYTCSIPHVHCVCWWKCQASEYTCMIVATTMWHGMHSAYMYMYMYMHMYMYAHSKFLH